MAKGAPPLPPLWPPRAARLPPRPARLGADLMARRLPCPGLRPRRCTVLRTACRRAASPGAGAAVEAAPRLLRALPAVRASSCWMEGPRGMGVGGEGAGGTSKSLYTPLSSQPIFPWPPLGKNAGRPVHNAGTHILKAATIHRTIHSSAACTSWSWNHPSRHFVAVRETPPARRDHLFLPRPLLPLKPLALELHCAAVLGHGAATKSR